MANGNYTDPGESLILPTDELTIDECIERLAAVHGRVGNFPHSTIELNIAAALTDQTLKQDDVLSYIDNVVYTQGNESALAIASQIVGSYNDALKNKEAITLLLKQTSKHQSNLDCLGLATMKRYEDSKIVVNAPDLQNLDIDDDYMAASLVGYERYIVQSSPSDVLQTAEDAYIAEHNRAEFWSKQIIGEFEEGANGQQLVRRGLIDSDNPEIQALLLKTYSGGRL